MTWGGYGELVMTTTPSTTTPAIQGLHKAWEAAEAEDTFWREHYSRLLVQYPDQFVAVRDGHVVATSTDLQQLLRSLDERRLEPQQVWARFVTADVRRVMP